MKENKNTQPTDMIIADTQSVAVNKYIMHDLWTSIFIVSIFANLVVAAVWIALKATSSYDSQLVGFLFNR